jgi:serine/threonine protein kinase
VSPICIVKGSLTEISSRRICFSTPRVILKSCHQYFVHCMFTYLRSRSEIMGLPPSIGCPGSQLFTCRQVFAAASHTLPPNSSLANVSNGRLYKRHSFNLGCCIAYDARLVDIWACGIVYYCLHFQEMPWRAAQTSDSMYASYASACASSNVAQSASPPTISNLSPRACRPLIRQMLEPNPKLRWTTEQIMVHPWVQGVEVCYLSERPNHVHQLLNNNHSSA